MCTYKYDTLTSRLSNKSIQKEKKEATSINSLTIFTQRLQDIYMGMCNFADLSINRVIDHVYIYKYIYIHWTAFNYLLIELDWKVCFARNIWNIHLVINCIYIHNHLMQWCSSMGIWQEVSSQVCQAIWYTSCTKGCGFLRSWEVLCKVT